MKIGVRAPETQVEGTGTEQKIEHSSYLLSTKSLGPNNPVSIHSSIIDTTSSHPSIHLSSMQTSINHIFIIYPPFIHPSIHSLFTTMYLPSIHFHPPIYPSSSLIIYQSIHQSTYLSTINSSLPPSSIHTSLHHPSMCPPIYPPIICPLT